jgi:serine/threonine protein kinase
MTEPKELPNLSNGIVAEIKDYTSSDFSCDYLTAGTYGRIFKIVTNKDNYVIKQVKRKKNKNKIPKETLREFEILKMIRESEDDRKEYIVSLNKIFKDEKYFYALMEWCTEGCAFESVQTNGVFSIEEAKDIIRDVTIGLDFIHDLGYIHGDIKVENIFLSNNIAKIGDFGHAIKVNPPRSSVPDKMASSTLSCMAPERRVYGSKIDYKLDIWGLGVVIYELLVDDDENFMAKEPKKDEDYAEDDPDMEASMGDYMEDYLKKLIKDKRMRKLIAECLQYNPEDRPNEKRILKKYLK